MIKTIYNKNQYIINLLIFNIFWNTVRIIQWKEIQPERFSFILKYITIDFVMVLAICLLMVYIYKWAANKKPLVIPVAVFICFSIFFAGLVIPLANSVKDFIWPEGILYKTSLEVIKSSFYYYIWFIIAFGGIFYLTRFRLIYLQQKEAILKAESLAKDTQLKMLRYQINPHFLFNILNSLHALVDENKNIAKKLIIYLSEYYRFTLDKQVQKNSIKNEISIIEKYFEIQKIRFEENLEYEITVDEKAKSIQIPSFIIHLLVENAIKYGLKCFEKKLVIKLNIILDKKKLSISVVNSGKLIPAKQHATALNEGTGSGIENINNRLKLFYQENFAFSLREENDWVIAKIDIDKNGL
ncbi:MAG: histidine kinase [Bacteroidales bacterium]|nr:histidine kinase [Bacteroidales bacterium]